LNCASPENYAWSVPVYERNVLFFGKKWFVYTLFTETFNQCYSMIKSDIFIYSDQSCPPQLFQQKYWL
jgi:hypothetical protein